MTSMAASTTATRRGLSRTELVERWRAIEDELELDDDDNGDDQSLDSSSSSSRYQRNQQAKEQWFSAAYNFLMCLPKDEHVWCGFWDIIGPFLETFYNYYKVDGNDSPLKILWERISQEMRRCTECISRHHQAQEMYKAEYESSFISPLLDILQSLDEERVSQHIKEANARLSYGGYNLAHDNAEIVSLMFEVLTFPVLLDDEFIVNEFQKLIETVDDAHELALAKQQHFPGVYALLFFKSRKSRSIGHRLAGNMGKMRCATDLEPLQPLLKRCIAFLSGEVMQSSSEFSRARVQMDRMTVWLGLKALLSFLEPPALEEGILEPYPVFLNFVLDHINDDSPEFSHAVNCMRLLFEILGCKLWLRTSLPPSVMRDSLLSQCFHTRNEKTHKEIFDLFQPLLQSLEALHDGEFEKQRRHLLFFLLHQVTKSSNFSMLMRKKACQIALLIVHRGYKMSPPSPPTECAHMWGPSLLSSLKDPSLHTSLRQPAIDLIQTILVSDAAALLHSYFHCQTSSKGDSSIPFDWSEEMDDVSLYAVFDDEKVISCWSEFTSQSNIVCPEYIEWLCIPMLWLDLLVEIDPSVLSISILKAVLWALSRFSMVEAENSSELSIPVKSWLSSSAVEVSAHFGWKSPTGSNDGGDGSASKNSVRVSTMCIPLIKTFRRLAAYFITRMEQGELQRQWTWESQMGECLILMISDPNDNIRQVGRRILEHVSGTRGLAPGLQFLCSSVSSLSATLSGLKLALKLVLLDSVLVNFQGLHHFYFVLCKIFKEGFSSPTHQPAELSNELNLKFASQGGFLRQTTFDSLDVNDGKQVLKTDKKSWESFSSELARAAWPPVKKCLQKGKAFVDYRISQMTCVRVLEILPTVFEKLNPLSDGPYEKSSKMHDLSEFSWLLDFVDWGKSALEVVVRYWKQSLNSLLLLIKSSCNEKSGMIIASVEKMILSDAVSLDLLTEQVSCLSVSLSTESSYKVGAKGKLKSMPHGKADGKRSFTLDMESCTRSDDDVHILDAFPVTGKKDKNDVVLLSDDESETLHSREDIVREVTKPFGSNVLPSSAGKRLTQRETGKKVLESGTTSITLEAPEKRAAPKAGVLRSESHNSGVVEQALEPISHLKVKDKERTENKIKSLNVLKVKDKETSEKELKSKSVPNVHLSSLDEVITRRSSAEAVKTKDSVYARKKLIAGSNDSILKEIVRDTEDPLELALKSAGRNHSSLTKLGPSLPKRRVIQLADPVDSRSAYLRKLEFAARRSKPPNMDNWFRPILEMDYFAAVGLDTAQDDENMAPCVLKEVPVSFESSQQYVEIFRPLVLEEFKAQLRSSFQEVSSLEEMSCGSLSVVSVERVDDFHLVRCVHDEHDPAVAGGCMENDLVLLSKQPLKNSPNKIHVIGKVERREKDNKRRLNMLLIRCYLQGGSSRLNRARKLLLERSKWFLGRIMSITPQLREFQALSSAEVIPAIPVVLRPAHHFNSFKEHNKVNLSKLSQPMQKVLRSTFNESQMQAISAVVESRDSKNDFELSLVQGPPGTGKTRTIVALISTLLALPSQSSAAEKQFSGSVKMMSTPFANFRKSISESAAVARAWQDAALARQLNNDKEKDARLPKTSVRKRVLVCAQSNAAVDELVSRLAGEGLYGVNGNMYKPYLVRVGNAKTIHPNSLPFFIDTLVEQRLEEEKLAVAERKNESNEESSSLLRESLEKIVDRIKFYESKRANLEDGPSEKNVACEDENDKVDNGKKLSSSELEARLRNLYQQKKDMYMRLAAIQSREKKVNEETRALRNKLRRSILREAEIVVTTLSGCGGDLYTACFESTSNSRGNLSEHNLFDAVVIDEAAQALEPATLIPLQLLKSSGTNCIMVGDPKQLPATVLSSVASRYLYECSMFERLQRAGHPVIMLTEQYRMHPEISSFPSLHFYDGKLLNGVQASSKTSSFHKTLGLGPYIFYDVTDGKEHYGKNSGSSSLYNEAEADAAIEIVRFLQRRHPSEFVGERIGIITPYRSQLSLLRSRFSSVFGSSISSEMEFNTVDGFQGREVDILILSTVRSGETCPETRRVNSSIGFVADVRRMNVALTRARLSLWVLGNSRTLQKNGDWAALMKDAEERNLVITLKRPYKSVFETLSKSSSFKRSDNIRDDIVREEVDKSQPVMRTESNYENYKREKNRMEMRHKHDKYEAREGLQDAKNREGATDQHKKLPQKQQFKKDSRKSYKEKSTRGVEQSLSGSSHDKFSDLEPGGVEQVKNQGNKGGLTTHENRKLLGKRADESGQTSVEIEKPKDLSSKRKQQREAVDALLSSSLISSKKSTNSSKTIPRKRSLSPSSKSVALKPTKQQKDNQADKRNLAKDKSLDSLRLGKRR
ncbi:uncharacterized protein LOC141591568 [Silene latifolia]|uniref:uncharacterized protein LOC141591568 n=1 Tax=Silene latifolia TaxID=37657 RepID=UPI003D775DB0